MTRKPTYPEDVPVGEPVGKSGPDDEGEAAPPATRPADPKRTRRLVTGAAIGIGSAAQVAALLYANRSRKGENGGPKGTPRRED